MKYSSRQSALPPETTAQVLEKAKVNANVRAVARQAVVTVTVVLISLITILVSTG